MANRARTGTPGQGAVTGRPGSLYAVGRFLQLLAMSLLLLSIVTAGPLGPSPRLFGGGVAVFVIGWLIVRSRTRA